MPADPDAVARCVLAAFDALPSKSQPRPGEWVPLAGVVVRLSKSRYSQSLQDCTCRPVEESARPVLTCVALGTGMKCLPSAKVPLANGVVLHDWHAEVLALRAFNRFLVEECARLVSADCAASDLIRLRDEADISEKCPQPFALQDDAEIYLYCSEAPCGDASMELTMHAQEDATPWDLPPKSTETSDVDSTEEPLRGRGYFSELGIVRRKPGRPDAPPTLSKSCTDKIAMKQCTSLLNAVTALLVSPKNAYLEALVLPDSQHVPDASERAFGPKGRMSTISPKLTQNWVHGGYDFCPFEVCTTLQEFAWSRRSGQLQNQKLVPSNISALYTAHHNETLINGVLQGRKQTDPKGASVISRSGFWKSAVEVAKQLPDSHVGAELIKVLSSSSDYGDLKRTKLLQLRQQVKDDCKKNALKGWIPNRDDDNFDLSILEKGKRQDEPALHPKFDDLQDLGQKGPNLLSKSS
ncbi:adenosine-deaminase [Phyllosticta citriasiana]|uniref:Adenosine-deaminase n=2 Tax=Phyllosticta citriasiana TaxID=595635 RepID=A0ABR1L1G7_9PEZI